MLLKLPRAELEELRPDIEGFTRVHQSKVRGVIVTMLAATSQDPSGRPYDFLSRYFSPWNGIPEDPVTGKCVL